MSFKKKMLTAFVTLGVSMPLLAQANGLTIDNRTNEDSTIKANVDIDPHAACSSALPDGRGTTGHGQVNPVPDSDVKLACRKNKSNCRADVYMNASCGGAPITTIYLNVDNGLPGTDIKANGYHIYTTNPFYVVIEYDQPQK